MTEADKNIAPKEVTIGFVVTSCNGSILLELGKKVFDQMASFVDKLVIRVRSLAILLNRITEGAEYID